MTDLELYMILMPIVKKVTGVQSVILGDPNENAPDGLYAAIRPSQTINQRGAPFRRRKNGVVPETVEDSNEVQILADASINFYRSGSMDACRKLKGCNFRSDVSADLFRAGLGWMGTQAINNLSDLHFGRIEERAQITINLAYSSSDHLVINSIERVPVQVENEKTDVLVTFDITE